MADDYLNNFATQGDVNQILTNLGYTGLDVNNRNFATRGGMLAIAEAIQNIGGGGSGGGAWGEITGTLSNQTDLQNALDEKAKIFTRSSTTESTIQLLKDTQIEITNTPTSLVLSFEAPETSKATEYRLTFIAGANLGVTITPPTNYTVLDAPEEYTEGLLYELSFVAYNGYLVCRCATTEVPVTP